MVIYSKEFQAYMYFSPFFFNVVYSLKGKSHKYNQSTMPDKEANYQWWLSEVVNKVIILEAKP